MIFLEKRTSVDAQKRKICSRIQRNMVTIHWYRLWPKNPYKWEADDLEIPISGGQDDVPRKAVCVLFWRRSFNHLITFAGQGRKRQGRKRAKARRNRSFLTALSEDWVLWYPIANSMRIVKVIVTVINNEDELESSSHRRQRSLVSLSANFCLWTNTDDHVSY